jgi:hypothetical protein
MDGFADEFNRCIRDQDGELKNISVEKLFESRGLVADMDRAVPIEREEGDVRSNHRTVSELL